VNLSTPRLVPYDLFDWNVPRKPRLVGGVKRPKAKMKIPRREALPCLSRPYRMGGELQMGKEDKSAA
jgi:hypothetical protein